MIQYFPTYVVLLPNLSIKSSTTFHISVSFQVQIFICLLWTRNQMLKNQTDRISDFVFNDKSRSNKIILSLGLFALIFCWTCYILFRFTSIYLRLDHETVFLGAQTYLSYNSNLCSIIELLLCYVLNQKLTNFLLSLKLYSVVQTFFPIFNYDNTSSIYVQCIIGSLQTIHCLLSWLKGAWQKISRINYLNSPSCRRRYNSVHEMHRNVWFY